MKSPWHPVSRRRLLAALPLLGWAAGALAQGKSLPVSDLVIVTKQGRPHFKVELALDAAAQAQGLMFRKEMAADAGMLFDFGLPERPAAFWMKNTLIPLDMLFIKADGVIVEIAERTIPLSLATIGPDQPVRAVLELNGGTSARLGIAAGDRVLHKIFGNLP